MRYAELGENVHDFIFEGQTDFCLEKVIGDQDSLQLMTEAGHSVFLDTVELAEALQAILELEGRKDAVAMMMAVVDEIRASS